MVHIPYHPNSDRNSGGAVADADKLAGVTIRRSTFLRGFYGIAPPFLDRTESFGYNTSIRHPLCVRP